MENSNIGAALAGINFEKLGKFILSCKKAEVVYLRLGELEVKFRESVSETGQSPNIPLPGQAFEDFTTTHEDNGQQGDTSEHITLMDKSEIFETGRVQQLIDDPEGFEQSMVDAHVENQRVRDNAAI